MPGFRASDDGSESFRYAYVPVLATICFVGAGPQQKTLF